MFYRFILGFYMFIFIYIVVDYFVDELVNVWGKNVVLMYECVL